MNIIVLDLEASCWDNSQRIPREESEIIEIGAVKLNQDYEILEEFDTFVRPTFHPAISDYCTQLTSIKQSDVQDAPEFAEAMSKFETWCGEDVLFMSWGFYDKSQIIRECNRKRYKGKMPQLITNHISAKHKIMALENLGKLSFGAVLKRFKLEFEGTPHRGIDDTRNIVKVVKLYRGRL